MIPKSLVREMFDAAVSAVRPDALVGNFVRLEGEQVRLGTETIQLGSKGRIIVIGAGKASAGMAQALEFVLRDRIHSGLVITKYGHSVPCQKIRIIEAGHPYPDRAGVEATLNVVGICQHCGERDLIICLLSGGGSALLADCPPGVSLEEYIALTKALVNCGASIAEINAVRKHLSLVKGGQLARAAWPARIVTLALSDVVGDPLDVIASGPTYPDPSTYAEAVDVIERFEIAAPACAMEWLEKGRNGAIEETPKPGDPSLSRATNLVIGSNRVALEAALSYARREHVPGRIVTDAMQGPVAEAADFIVSEIRSAKAFEGDGQSGCLLFGGEPTLRVNGSGKGGRNQHLAMEVAKRLRGLQKVTVLCAGTDGTDGPTDAAGAIVDCGTWTSAVRGGIDPQGMLDNFGSYAFFRRAGGHVITGPTQTNVMDVVIALIA